VSVVDVVDALIAAGPEKLRADNVTVYLLDESGTYLYLLEAAGWMRPCAACSHPSGWPRRCRPVTRCGCGELVAQ
jgi:hypothetical protein